MIYIKMMQSKLNKEQHFKGFIFMSLFCITTSEQLSLVHKIDIYKHPVLDIHDHGFIETYTYKTIVNYCQVLIQTVPIGCSCINPQNNQYIIH